MFIGKWKIAIGIDHFPGIISDIRYEQLFKDTKIPYQADHDNWKIMIIIIVLLKRYSISSSMITHKYNELLTDHILIIIFNIQIKSNIKLFSLIMFWMKYNN